MKVWSKLKKRILHIRFNHSHNRRNQKEKEIVVKNPLTSTAPTPTSPLELMNSGPQPNESQQINLTETTQLTKVKLQVKTDFLLQIMKVSTPRQSGRLVNIFVNYRYTNRICRQLDEGKIPDGLHDYTAIRNEVLTVFNDTNMYPLEIFWEFLLYKIAKHVYRKFDLLAISIQLQIEPSFNTHPVEPGFHSAIITIGPIEPLAGIIFYEKSDGFI